VTDRDVFMAEVQRAAQGTPYVVEPTGRGFDVRIDVADATWYALMYKEGIHKVFTHHVQVDEEQGRYSVTDDGYDVEWQAGADVSGSPRPRLSASAERQVGTSREISFRKEYAWDEQGRHGKVVDYTFSSGEGNQLIRAAAERLGLRPVLPFTSKLALVIGIVAAAGAVVVVVLLLVAAALGKF